MAASITGIVAVVDAAKTAMETQTTVTTVAIAVHIPVDIASDIASDIVLANATTMSSATTVTHVVVSSQPLRQLPCIPSLQRQQ